MDVLISGSEGFIGLNLVKSPKIKKYPTNFLNKYTSKNISKLMLFRSIKYLYEKKINYLIQNKMYLIGDIGNTEIKICLFDKNYKVVKKLILKTNSISNKYLSSNLNFLKKYSPK